QFGHAGIDSRFTTEDIFRGADFSSFFKDLGGGFGGGIFEDFFSDAGFDIFGSGRSSRKRKGEDIHYETEVCLEDAAKGIEKKVNFVRSERCSACSGTGAEPGSLSKICPTCKGRGQVVSGMGFINFSQTCPTCQGEGSIVSLKCSKCRGAGKIKVNKNVTVNIPAGVDTGSVMRLRNEGSYGPGAYGDLYLHLRVKKHPLFERGGSNIKCRVTVSMTKAVLGAEVEVPVLNGKAKMKVPPGTQSGTVFRLKGKGTADLRTKRIGDELIEIEVEMPKKLSLRERKLLLEFARLRKEL
ncbi:MAG: DnaJ C-terminal domain-containing protein, partial [Elusimicrobiota bacterium]|nr:DnaJ C-terminal domain-containing protein [Elusimicrobiota bacterium]